MLTVLLVFVVVPMLGWAIMCYAAWSGGSGVVTPAPPVKPDRDDSDPT